MTNVYQTSANALNGAIGLTNKVGAAPNVGFGAPMSGGGGLLAGANLNQYMNPYTQNVINTTMGTMRDQYRQGVNELDAQASAAGAFGGSRHGVAQAMGAQNFNNTVAQTAAGLNQQNFAQAQQGAQFDIGNRLNNAQFNAGQQLQTNQLNQAGRQNWQSNQLAAAGQLGQLSNLGFGMGQQVNAGLNAAGSQQQALMQQLINAGKGQYQGYQQSPMQGLSAIISAISGSPGSAGTTTQTSSPGLLGMLAGGASILGAPWGGTTIGASLGGLCWVARAVYGDERWLGFRKWMLLKSPKWLFKAYVEHGPAVAEWVERNPWSKRILRPIMDKARAQVA